MVTDNEAGDGVHPQAAGLFINPFRYEIAEHEDDPTAVLLTKHNAAAAMLTAVRRSVDRGTFRPVWVEKDPAIPTYYHLQALAEVLSMGSADGPLGLLVAYVPLPFMKNGRVRAALSTMSERVTGPSLSNTLGNYMAAMLETPDTGLPEWAAVEAGDLAGLRSRLASDPAAVADQVFGDWMSEREGSEDLEMLMRETSARMGTLDKDPDLAADSDESEAENIDLDDLAVGAAPMPLHEDDLDAELRELTGEAPADEPVDEQPVRTYEDAVADYTVAHLRTHLSPVVARSVAAYREKGAAAAAQELKITKAPRKTLKAIGALASHGFDAIVIAFDQFAGWERISPEVRAQITSSLTEMRWALDGAGVVAIMSHEGQTPELEEQFAAAERVDWDFKTLAPLEEGQGVAALPTAEWLAATSLGEPTVSADDPVFAVIEQRADGDLDAYVAMAAAALDDAMLRDSAVLDESAVPSLESMSSTGGAEGEQGRA